VWQNGRSSAYLEMEPTGIIVGRPDTLPRQQNPFNKKYILCRGLLSGAAGSHPHCPAQRARSGAKHRDTPDAAPHRRRRGRCRRHHPRHRRLRPQHSPPRDLPLGSFRLSFLYPLENSAVVRRRLRRRHRGGGGLCLLQRRSPPAPPQLPLSSALPPHTAPVPRTTRLAPLPPPAPHFGHLLRVAPVPPSAATGGPRNRRGRRPRSGRRHWQRQQHHAAKRGISVKRRQVVRLVVELARKRQTRRQL